jgi:hypothetical protein
MDIKESNPIPAAQRDRGAMAKVALISDFSITPGGDVDGCSCGFLLLSECHSSFL